MILIMKNLEQHLVKHLAPTRIYVKALKSIKNAGVRVHACSHITGGGFYENIPRMLKEEHVQLWKEQLSGTSNLQTSC